MIVLSKERIKKNVFALLILLRSTVMIDSANKPPCDPPEDGSMVWRDNPENNTVIVEVGNKKRMCSTYSACFGQGHDEPLPQQVFPIVIQAGMKINISIPRDINGTEITVYVSSKEAFMSCEYNSTTDQLDIIIEGNSFEIPVDNFSIGHNYLLFDTPGSTIRCNDGNRVNVTVKGSACAESEHDVPCSSRGYCTSLPLDPTFTCRCCDGYTGYRCENSNHDNNDATSCDEVVCKNGGTCVEWSLPAAVLHGSNITDKNDTSTLMNAHCECISQFTGTFCETRLDHCKSNPCVHGLCVEKAHGSQCFCIPGYHGKSCELEYNECLSSPCKYGGTCVDRIDKFECRCTPGHSGVNCEVKVDMCRPNPCHRNALCTNQDDTFQCQCPPGVTGHTCALHVNECSSNPCKNDGKCKDLENGFECICPLTFAGVHCEYMMDVFAPPLESPEMTGRSHKHNIYIVAGTLSGAIALVAVVLVACYCKMNETYKQFAWRRMRYKKRSLSCPDLESYSQIASANKPRLSVDAIWEATSLCHDNASFDSPLRQQRI